MSKGQQNVSFEQAYAPLFPLGKDTTHYRKVSDKGLSFIPFQNGHILYIAHHTLIQLAQKAFYEIAHFLRPSHLNKLAKILNDPQASENDKFVALDLLKNACVSAGGILPMCQDTGTGIVFGKKGQYVITEGSIEEAFAHGLYETYTQTPLRYSQMAPLTMYEEKNTNTNLPLQCDILNCDDPHKAQEMDLLFLAKGGGSANKTFLYQQTRALLSSEEKLLNFLIGQIKTLGTSACPPYHLAIVIGGLSAELTLKTVKLASAGWYDALPGKGSQTGQAFRDKTLEDKIFKKTQEIGIGAQFGGKYFCHDVRVIRLPRHAASLPIGIGVSCSADRQIKAKITSDGVFLENLEHDPAKYLPPVTDKDVGKGAVKIDLNQPMKNVCKKLSQYPVKTRLSLNGTVIVARDIAHARFLKQLEEKGTLPSYLKDHPIYYAGPAKRPPTMPTGSFGPTTAGRMDPYVEPLQSHGASLIMLAKGNRSLQVRESCKKYGGFYLGSVGGPAAELAQESIKKMEVLDFPELGMEAVWKIEVKDFPAFIIIDDKGHDFYNEINKGK